MTKLDRKNLARWRNHPTDFIEEVLVDPETAKPFVLLSAERVFLHTHSGSIRRGGYLIPSWCSQRRKSRARPALLRCSL
jgi:hypothetical protein